MIYKKNFNSFGATIIESIAVISIIIIISSIMVANFPKLQKEFALSRSAYKLAQNFRKVQDLGFSASIINDKEGNPIEVAGYGIHMDLDQSENEFIVYADINKDFLYFTPYSIYCSKEVNIKDDCILDIININEDDGDLYIKNINGISGRIININFSIPVSNITISSLSDNYSYIEIILGFKKNPNLERKVSINKAGLIEVK